MKRRQFLGAAALSGALAGYGIEAKASPRRKPPNLLYVFSDQHRAVSVQGMPYNQALAPNIAAFGRQNFSMERCVSNYPLCTPYRGILMSGRYPQQTGLISNNIALPADPSSLGHAFADQGYRTGYVGKWHLQGPSEAFIPPGPDRQGFQDWHVWVDTNDHYHSWTYDPETGTRIEPAGWNCTSMTDQAIGLLRRQDPQTPWFVVVSWNPPHPPFNPPAADQAPYKPDSLVTRPNVRLTLKGEDIRKGIARALTSETALREAMQGYFGGITGVDQEFARLLAALSELDQDRDTIVVYTSDHGEMLGSQGRMAKQVPFEEACRVPFYVRYPGVTPEGGASDTLFAAVDIYPTLCGLAGVPVPGHCAGRDLSTVLRGGWVAGSPAVFLMNHVPDTDAGGSADDDVAETAEPIGKIYTTAPNYRGVRTETHTYAVAQDGRWCLYDNVIDPYQLTNLIEDADQATLMDRLDVLIAEWLVQTRDDFPFARAVRRISTVPL